VTADDSSEYQKEADSTEYSLSVATEITAEFKRGVSFPSVTLCVLSYRTPQSLNSSLHTWQKNGLLQSVNRTIVFVQEISRDRIRDVC